MTGETNLKHLLKTMGVFLHNGDYVFSTINDNTLPGFNEIILFFREEEGYTVILEKERADQLGLDYSFVASWITLNVHSSLEAVGFTAAFSQALAAENIPCNVVAGYFHDHLFVQQKDREKAIAVLEKLSAE